MAAANSDQESGLLPSDEGSLSAPPHARRLPIKAPVAVCLCVFAAGLAGAVVMGMPAARAPTKIWHPWAATGLNDHEPPLGRPWVAWAKGRFGIGMDVPEHQYVSEECVDLLEALWKEAEEHGRTHTIDYGYSWYLGRNRYNDNNASGQTLDCKKSEQVCNTSFAEICKYTTTDSSDPDEVGRVYYRKCDFWNTTQCYPAVCKLDNIIKDWELIFNVSLTYKQEELNISDFKVSCGAGTTTANGSSTNEQATNASNSTTYECCFFFWCFPEKQWFTPWCPGDTA